MSFRHRRRQIAALAAAALLAPSAARGQDAPPAAREVLERALAAGPWDAAAVAEALGPASPRRVAELRLLLGDGDPIIRVAAVRTLTGLGDHPVQALVRLLDDDNRTVRAAAEDALVAAGPAAVEALGDVLMTQSCLAESFKAAPRLLGRIGDPAGAPLLANALVKYRAGGLPQQAGTDALRAIGGPAAVAQLMQLTDFRDLGQQAFLALIAIERDELLRAAEALLADPAADPELRFAYALRLNEVAGSAAAAPLLVRFFGALAADAALAPALRARCATSRNLFAGITEEAPLFRPPLTAQQLNKTYAERGEEESPFIEARRKQEREMDAIRGERRRKELPRGWIIGPSVRTGR